MSDKYKFAWHPNSVNPLRNSSGRLLELQHCRGARVERCVPSLLLVDFSGVVDGPFWEIWCWSKQAFDLTLHDFSYVISFFKTMGTMGDGRSELWPWKKEGSFPLCTMIHYNLSLAISLFAICPLKEVCANRWRFFLPGQEGKRLLAVGTCNNSTLKWAPTNDSLLKKQKWKHDDVILL